MSPAGGRVHSPADLSSAASTPLMRNSAGMLGLQQHTPSVGHTEIDLASVCGAQTPMYFVHAGFMEVASKNLKKRVTGDISSIQKDDRDHVWVVFDGQRVYAEFDHLTQPMKVFLAQQFRKVLEQEAVAQGTVPEKVMEIANIVKCRDLSKRARRTTTTAPPEAMMSPSGRRVRAGSRSPTPDLILQYKRRRFDEDGRDQTQPMRMNAGPFIEPAVYVPPPSLSIEYTTVVANEFQGALHRAMGDLDGKFRNLQHMCTALHAENDQLKREGYPAMVLEELERVKAKVARLERENEVLELQLREKTAALDAIRKCIPSAAPAPGEMLE
ncbi:hypothetical protein AMAG_10904, partial [Allomyces macrogynus ATCC 38327]